MTEELLKLLARQIEEHGVVVWYDPAQHYARVAGHLDLRGVTVLRFERSFFRLREQMDPHLEFVTAEGCPLPEVSAEVVEKVDPIFYSDPLTAALKALAMN